MTEHQRKARDYLDQYRKACVQVHYLKLEVDFLRAQAENLKSDTIETGWTGRMIMGEKETAQIGRGRKPADNRQQEMALCHLADMSTKLDKKRNDAQALNMEISAAIDDFVDSIEKRICLKMRHLLNKKFREIGEVISYTEQHTSRIYYEALEDFGRRIK